MTDTSAAIPSLTIAILSSHCLVWLGLQKILESSTIVPMVVLPYQKKLLDLLRAESRPDLFILDVDTERQAVGILTQIREAVPASKIVLLCGLEDRERTREAFAAGVDGIILKVQPAAVVLAVVEALYAPATSHVRVERDRAREISLGAPFTTSADSAPPLSAWPEALTDREREIIGLVGHGLSNKDIAYKLSISDSTVRHHLTSIFDKVGVPNRQKLMIHSYQFHFPHGSPP